MSRYERMILTCVRTHAPIASQARHFPRERGQLTSKEERIHVFLYNSNKKNNEMTHIKKSSPDTGKVAALAVGRGKLEQTRKNE